MWTLVDTRAGPGQREVPQPSPDLGMSVLLAIPTVGAIFKDAALRKQCVTDTIWKVYVAKLHLFAVQLLSHVWLFVTHRLQHPRPPCPSPFPGACSNSCASSQWCHLTISSSIVPSPSCLQFFLASGSFPMSRLFESVVQCISASASASVLPMNIQNWFPLRLTGLISLLSKGLSSLLQHHSSKALIFD